MLAKFTHVDALKIDTDEARMIAEGVASVAAQYDAIAVSPKTQAWIELAGALGMVYGLRIMTVAMPDKAKKASVTPINAVPANGTFDSSSLTSIPGQ